MSDFNRSVSVLVNAAAQQAVEEIRLNCIPDNVRMTIGAYRSKEWEQVIRGAINNCTSDLKLALKLALEGCDTSYAADVLRFLSDNDFTWPH